MDEERFYRGGNSLVCRAGVDVKIDKATGLLRTSHGVSVYDRADHPNVLNHGGAFLKQQLPAFDVEKKLCLLLVGKNVDVLL